MTVLTDKYRALLYYYFGEAKFNKAKAAELAGFKSANKYAERLFRHPAVAAELAKHRAQIEDQIDISKEKIAQELAAVGFANVGDLVEPDENGDFVVDYRKLNMKQRKAMNEVSTEIYMEGRGPGAKKVKKAKAKFAPKTQALVELAKLMGYTNDTKNMVTDEALVAMLNAGRNRVKDE
jgi:hypothetical protein